MEAAQAEVEGRKVGRFLMLVTREEMKLIVNSLDLFLAKHSKKKGLGKLFREFQNLNCR
jgi:hypothetical protein